MPLSFPLSERWASFGSGGTVRTASMMSSGGSSSSDSDGVEAWDERRAQMEAEGLAAAAMMEGGVGMQEMGMEEAKDEKAAAQGEPPTQHRRHHKKKTLDDEDGGPRPRGFCGWLRRRRTRKEWALLIGGVTLGLAALGACIFLATYAIILRTIDPPALFITQCRLVDLAFAGPNVNAVIGVEGAIQNRCRYPVWIDSPKIHVWYPNLETGVQIGDVQLPSLTLAPHGRETRAVNSSFYDVNHAGDGEPGKEGLGKQLVADVLGNQASSLGLTAAVAAHASVAPATEGALSMLPRVPVKLHLRCHFVNHWGPLGPEAAECMTHLHPFWKRL